MLQHIWPNYPIRAVTYMSQLSYQSYNISDPIILSECYRISNPIIPQDVIAYLIQLSHQGVIASIPYLIILLGCYNISYPIILWGYKISDSHNIITYLIQLSYKHVIKFLTQSPNQDVLIYLIVTQFSHWGGGLTYAWPNYPNQVL